MSFKHGQAHELSHPTSAHGDTQVKYDDTLNDKSSHNSDDPDSHLPFSNWLARKFIKPNTSDLPNLYQKLSRSLLWFVIREIATWEDIFDRSKLHNIMRKFIPSSILPNPSIHPFTIILLLASIQVRKLWIWQRHCLIQAFITLHPILSTIGLLTRLQHHPSTSQKSEMTRWLSYWLIYGTISNLENIKVWPKLNSTPSSSSSYPPLPIYPPRSSIHNLISLDTLHRAFQHSKQYLLHQIRTRPNSSRTTTKLERKPFPEPPPHRSPKVPGFFHSSNDTYHSIPFLHDKLLGEHSLIYIIIKVIFLKWCSSHSQRGSEYIWNHLISPLVSLIQPLPPSKEITTREVKIVIVDKPLPLETIEQDKSLPLSPRFTPDLITQDQTQPTRIPLPQRSPIHSKPRCSTVESTPSVLQPTDDDPDLGPKSDPPDQLHASNLIHHSIEKPLLVDQDFRTPDNAWDSLSYVA